MSLQQGPPSKTVNTGPVRIFHLVKGLGRGGAETLLVRTSHTEPLTPRRNAYGYFLPWKDALVPELQAEGCAVRCFSARNPVEMILRLPELLSFLRSWRPDLIHGHLPLAGVMGRLAGKILGVPVVYTEHNLQERYHPLTRIANRLTWPLQAQAIAVSAEVQESISRSLPSSTPSQIVLNGVDCEKFTPDPGLREKVRADLGIASSDFLIGTVAVFRKQKRLDLWLDAAKRLAIDFPDLQFVMVGDGPERPTVENLIAEYGLSSRVHLPGLSADVLPYYCAFDAFFMSSDFEGLPVALLEAMACEVPAVVTDAGGIGEVIRDPQEGLVASVGDVDQLTSHLRALASDRERAQEIGRQGRRRVQEAFSLARMSEELEGIYRKVLGRPPHSFPAKNLEGYSFDKQISDQESVNLIKLALGEGSERSPRTLEFFQWKHQANPFGNSYSLAARHSESNKAAGLRMFQRWTLRLEGQEMNAVRAVDTSTHPDHQRKGIFTALTRAALKEMTDEGVDLVFNTPNKNSLPGYLKMGWELVAQVPVQGKFLGTNPPETSGQGDSLDELLKNHTPRALEELLDGTTVANKIQITKDLAYLRWRYTEHPTIDYRFAVRETAGVPTALLVWCETKRYGLREFVLCELFANSVDSGSSLLAEALRGSPCHYAAAVFLHNPVAESVTRQHGFRTLPLKTIELTVNPLSEKGQKAVNQELWSFSAGDLQVF